MRSPLQLPAAVAFAACAAAWPHSSRWGACLHRLPTEDRAIALTFDDGPSNETMRFLEALGELEVPATFFVCGRNVERRPQVARAIVETGHAIGNHTHSHPRLPLCRPDRVRAEIVRTQELVADAAGLRPALFRAPFGLRSPELRRVLPELGLTAVHWSVIGRDWKRDADWIAKHVMRLAGPGAIVCLHDGQETRLQTDRSQTLAAVRQIVPQLRERGYRFVTLPDGGSPGSAAVDSAAH